MSCGIVEKTRLFQLQVVERLVGFQARGRFTELQATRRLITGDGDSDNRLLGGVVGEGRFSRIAGNMRWVGLQAMERSVRLHATVHLVRLRTTGFLAGLGVR